jgi:hypothetical protein
MVIQPTELTESEDVYKETGKENLHSDEGISILKVVKIASQ